MPTVRIQIQKQSYNIACGEGQEEHLKTLANKLSNRMDMLAATLKSANHTMLLLMAGLMLEDTVASNNPTSDDTAFIEGFDTIAEKIETLANSLENV